MVKPDEPFFLVAVAIGLRRGLFVRDIIARHGINHKRAAYLLLKWTGRNWYDYGVCLDLGWLTDAGFTHAERAAEKCDAEALEAIAAELGGN